MIIILDETLFFLDEQLENNYQSQVLKRGEKLYFAVCEFGH
jgi:hypothetical protein